MAIPFCCLSPGCHPRSKQVSMLPKAMSLCCGNFHLEPIEFSNIPLQADAFKRQINNSVSFL